MDKKIKESKRGLTFSFTPTETMQIGSRYDYIISNSGIRIVPSETGRYTVSRKRSGSGWNPLIDLRNREVLDAIAGMENIRLHITADSILVSGEAEHAVVLQFPRTLLAHARKVVGISDSYAVSRILEGTQITLDEYLASSKAPLDIAAIQKDLPDVYCLCSQVLASSTGRFSRTSGSASSMPLTTMPVPARPTGKTSVCTSYTEMFIKRSRQKAFHWTIR